ncbi:MAG: helix-turn-helix transcriptional regulator [Anaerotruncus sp.]|uniref:Helix-turn-helix transcriptional regulator n=1 Tax=Anaerotruncus colihominis TaxID=169435 RepID=A0A845SRA9_9FIRM|nr:helix-turn-helix transcriptional regulator [Anaerotruncus sp.]NDO38215.1 helix-turn-helix transcriptional regulator [Anaerotruncus colihominis]
MTSFFAYIIYLLKILVNSSLGEADYFLFPPYNKSQRRKGILSKEVQFQNRDRFIELGLTISALRKMRGMSQEELAERAKISRSHLSSIEAPNIIRPFSVEVLYNIADALEVRAGDLLNSSILPEKKK